ncbi:MAG TPA: hypothetical protein PLB04_04085, partial [Nitrospira sp.]|nr:hypothetical protein [Nitrospira sp.]
MSKCHADAFSEDYVPNQLISRAHSYPRPYTSERFLITEMTIFVWSMAIFAHRGGSTAGEGRRDEPGTRDYKLGRKGNYIPDRRPNELTPSFCEWTCFEADSSTTTDNN